jgi:hypothetical protein
MECTRNVWVSSHSLYQELMDCGDILYFFPTRHADWKTRIDYKGVPRSYLGLLVFWTLRIPIREFRKLGLSGEIFGGYQL